MHRAVVVRLLAAGALGSVLLGCSTDTPPGPDTMTAPMTVEQVRAEIEAAQARMVLPAGADWKSIELNEGMYGPYAGAQLIEWQAMCAWFLEARDAMRAGDQVRFGRALTVLAQVPDWRSFADPTLLDVNGRTIIRSGVDAAIEEGDFTAIGPFLQGNCLR